MKTDFLLVMCTCPDDASAAAIATALVEERLAACVNRGAGIRSLFRWQDQIEEDHEVLLLIKSRHARFGELEAEIRRLHPYDTPEIIGLPIVAGSDAYLQWMEEVTA